MAVATGWAARAKVAVATVKEDLAVAGLAREAAETAKEAVATATVAKALAAVARAAAGSASNRAWELQ